HMSRIDVRKDDVVQAGQLVGLVGDSNGPHLHLEYRKKQDHANGTHLALDPRDVFGCADPNTANADQDSNSTGGSPDVQGVKTEAGDVLQATTTAPNFGQFQQKYGFPAPNGAGEVDFEQHGADIAVLRDHAVKYAPMHNLEPEMVVWWTLVETRPPYTSVAYSNCGDTTYEPDINCPSPYSGGWQIGYGQQFAVLSSLPEAYAAVYGADTS